MEKYFFGKALLVRPKSLLILFAGLSLVIITLVVIELFAGREEINNLMAQQAESYLETIIHSSQVALISNEEIESVIIERLVNDAQLVDLLYQRNQISNDLLNSICNKNKLNRINIFDKTGKRIFASHPTLHNLEPNDSPLEFLTPIFKNETDTIILGLKPARMEGGFRYAVAIAAFNNNAIVININADEILDFRKMLGFGQFLKIAGESNLIEYIALQDESGIIAGTGRLDELESADSSEFILNALDEDNYSWRITDTREHNVFEAIHPFFYKGELVGIFRLGLSLEPLNSFNKRNTQRLIIVSIFLIIMGTITGGYSLVRSNYDFLKKQLSAAENFSERIIQNVSDAIFVLNKSGNITLANDSGAKLFGISDKNILGEKFDSIINNKKCSSFINSDKYLESFDCELGNRSKSLLVSKSFFLNEHGEKNMVLVIKDLTEIKMLEAQANRNERLLAMGELASGIAHEIRNPLNTIATIVQQLQKDFKPAKDENEYDSLTKLVREEVKRINSTVQSFLKFARPEPISFEEFDLAELFDQLKLQYGVINGEKNIEMIIPSEAHLNVEWDKNKMLQVFINLIQNSIDAIGSNGKIILEKMHFDEGVVEIRISDTGKGIPEPELNKIFNLYHTTKAEGNGIGLSIIQRIIYGHNGIITVDSVENKGTTFTIKLPIRPKTKTGSSL